MSKKRPRAQASRSSGVGSGARSKSEPAYWEERLFRSSYTYCGQTRHTRNWSVKIQHQGTRRTLVLKSGERQAAAIEACQLYRAILGHGWRALGSLPVSSDDEERRSWFTPGYWAQRLVRREYSLRGRPQPGRELSVRIEHEGTSHYFPLATQDPEKAAQRAARIFKCVVSRGWAATNQRFQRELTMAFRWLDNPLVWTYTTLHTRPDTSGPAEEISTNSRGAGGRLGVGIAEADPGLRRALARCIEQTGRFRCAAAVASPGDLMGSVGSLSLRLVMVNHDLADQTNIAGAGRHQIEGMPVAVLRYSVYEDSEELFKATPGGAPFYLLRRTPALHLLEPIAERLCQGPLSSEAMTGAAWQHFRTILSALPAVEIERPLSELTQREQEVLALLSKGHSDKAIAGRLGISIHTVHEHVRNTFEKLGVHNRIEAAVKFLQK